MSDDRNPPRRFDNAELEALGTELPPLQNDEYWLYELRGAEAQNGAGEVLGEVVRVVSNSMQLLLELKTPRGIELIPFVDAFIVGFRRDANILVAGATFRAAQMTRPFRLDIITLTPDIWPTIDLEATGLVGRAFRDGLVEYGVTNLRDYGKGVHRQVDDTPFGGGPGMLIGAEPTIEGHQPCSKANHNGPVIMLSPRGERFSQSIANALAKKPGMTLLCGRYEGFDERVRRHVDIDLSLGDFVLSGGDPAAWAITDAVVRSLPVLGNAASVVDESFEIGGFEHPQFTRPADLKWLSRSRSSALW